MGAIPSYPKVYGLGHAAIKDIFLDPVLVEEKVDGSQFSFAVLGGVLHMRSKGATVYDESEGGRVGEGGGMFSAAVDYVESIRPHLLNGYIYRCEYLNKPKHNTLKYARTPENWLILFDVEVFPEHSFLDVGERNEEAFRLGLEPIPFYDGVDVHSAADIDELLDQESFLGGPKIEGVVLKNHSRFGRDGKFLAAKYVSEAFKEKHGKEWKASNPKSKDIIQTISEDLRTEARWEKAIQHMRERGELTNTPRDIGPLMKEIVEDVKAECEDAIREALFKWAWRDIARQVGRGAPEWYKRRLMEAQFEESA